MFQLWKKIDAQQSVNHVLWIVIGMLLVIIVFCCIGWQTAPRQMTVYIPPDITTGITEKPNTIPKQDIYAFAYQIFSALNTWSFTGEKDYSLAILQYRNYLTTRFYTVLNQDYHERQTNGALSRTRMMTGYTGMGYDENTVKTLGLDTWEVDLTMHVVEQVGTSVVKDVLIMYPVRVVRVNESVALNPWGLALDGFIKEPVRIKTFI